MTEAKSKVNCKGLIVVIGIGLLLRIVWGAMQPSTIDRRTLPDQHEYLQLASNLLHGGELRFFDERFGQDVYAYRTPGYPMFVAACGESVRVVRAAQAILDSSTILAIWLLARRFKLARPVATLAAAFVAFNPFLIYFTGLILSETLTIALLAWGMLLLTHRCWRDLFIASVLLGLAALVRPSMIGLGVILGVVAQMNFGQGVAYQLRIRIARAIMPACVVVLMLMPWMMRNWHLLHRPIWTTTNGGITLYDGFHAGADGSSDQRFVKEMPELSTMSEVERSDYLSKLAWQQIQGDPIRALKLAGRKIVRTWSPVPLSAEYSGAKYRLVGLLFSLPFDALVLIGFCSVALPRPVKTFLILPAVYFTVVHALSVGSLRYRIPAEAPMSSVAAVGAAGIRGMCRRSRSGEQMVA